MNIEELNLSTRAYHCLKRAGLDTVEQLISKSKEDLMRLNGMGLTGATEVMSALKRLKLTNGDKIRGMDDKALADFLCSIAYAGHTPWSEPFARKFCDNCPCSEYTLEDRRKMKTERIIPMTDLELIRARLGDDELLRVSQLKHQKTQRWVKRLEGSDHGRA